MKHPVLARTVIAGLAISMLGVTGCSRDEKADDTGGTTTTVAKEVEKSKNFKLDAPVKIVALISDPTNSADPNSVADFNDGAKMAIEEINEAGGLGGHPIEFKSFDTPPVGDQVVNSLNLALEEKPTILVGPVSSTATLAITSKVAEAKVPLIHNSTDPGLATDGKGGNEWVFASRPRNDEAAKIGARFLTEELGAKKVGILGVNASFGQQGIAAAKEVLGDKVGAERTFEYNATNLTEPVQAMNGMDAIFDWGTPNTLAATVVTAGQQGLAIPHMGPGSIGFSSFKKGVGDTKLLENVYGTVDCNPTDDDRDDVTEWAGRFEAKYGYAPSYSAAELYDTVYMLRKIVEAAENASAETIRDGFKSIKFDDGMCATEYKNVNGFLTQESTVGQYKDGEFKTVKRFGPND